MTGSDPFNLERFVAAQETTFDTALAEVRRGAKRSHWMWYVFPQLAGLGSSEMARRYAIGSLEEAKAYLAHPVLGRRYRTMVEALQHLGGTDAAEVFGDVDARKLRSSLTLFALASGDHAISATLSRWFGDADPATVALMSKASARR